MVIAPLFADAPPFNGGPKEGWAYFKGLAATITKKEGHRLVNVVEVCEALAISYWWADSADIVERWGTDSLPFMVAA